ncbi:hypothetical protein CVT25_000954 [Psilocybe cyanescens]|uniref:Cell wall galactomannoprotein n=1 Tax=Psilocybe cyanescens TaxID=93625 RepID=A0A409XSC9_PSICY|nr:hypothetical protein CVT25_000954 [Psilocybe cyanescens]
MKIARVFVFLIGSQAVTAALLARGDATVERDLSFASSNLTALDTTLRTFVQSGGSLSQALDLHTESSSSFSAIDLTISDIKIRMSLQSHHTDLQYQATGAIASMDASNIENTVALMQSTVIDICQTFSQNLSVIGSASPSLKTLLEQDISQLLSAFDSLLVIIGGSTATPVSNTIANLKQQFENVCNPSTAPTKPAALSI